VRSLAERRPNFGMPLFNTNATAFVMAWRYLVMSQNELKPNGPWLYDFVDISRQALSNIFYDLYGLFSAGYKRNDLEAATFFGTKLIELISQIDVLLQSNENFLLGNWLESAKSFATTESQKRVYEFNARNQITLWGPTGQIVDYAAKSWAGLYSTYYSERWNFFIDSVLYAMTNKIPFDETNFTNALLIKEQQWCEDTTLFPTTAIGNSITIVNSLIYRYANSSSVDSTYMTIRNVDVDGKDLYQARTKDVDQLKILCGMERDCQGFNNNGFLKTNVSAVVESIGTVLYTKR